MNNKIAVLVDTNSGISKKKAEELGIYMIAMPFIVDNQEYLEGVDLDRETFYQKLVSGSSIHTSQPSLGDTSNMYDKILAKYDYIVHIPMSSALSKTYENSKMLSSKEEYVGKVFVVDNRRIAATLEHSVYETLKMIEVGMSAEQIKNFLESTSEDCSIYAMVDTLKYLKKGGRVTPAAALLGSLLGIKPVLQLQSGKLDAFAKCRTSKIARKTMIEQIQNDIENRFGDDTQIHIIYCDNFQVASEFKKEVKKIFNNVEEEMKEVSMSIACHTGPGVVAIACCKNHKFDKLNITK